MWRWSFIRFPSLFLVITQWKSCAMTLPVEHRTSKTSCWSTESAIRSGEYRGVLLRFGPQTYVCQMWSRKVKPNEREREREREIEKGNNNHVTICLAGQLCFIAKFMTKLDFHRSQGQQSWVSQFQRFRGRAFQWGKCFCPGLLGTGVWFHHHMLPQRCPELATISHPIGVIKPLSLQERGHGLAKHRLLPSQQSAGRSLSQENGKTEGLEWRRWQHGVSKWFGEDVKMHEKSCINCKIGVWC